MKTLAERILAWWKGASQPDPEPEQPKASIADAITTLAWCIFWGLLCHGCFMHGVEVTLNK